MPPSSPSIPFVGGGIFVGQIHAAIGTIRNLERPGKRGSDMLLTCRFQPPKTADLSRLTDGQACRNLCSSPSSFRSRYRRSLPAGDYPSFHRM